MTVTICRSPGLALKEPGMTTYGTPSRTPSFAKSLMNLPMVSLRNPRSSSLLKVTCISTSRNRPSAVGAYVAPNCSSRMRFRSPGFTALIFSRSLPRSSGCGPADATAFIASVTRKGQTSRSSSIRSRFVEVKPMFASLEIRSTSPVSFFARRVTESTSLAPAIESAPIIV